MSSTPRPSQKKQSSLTSFFTPKSGSHVASSSPLREAPASLPSRKRPLEEDAGRGQDKKAATRKRTSTSKSKSVRKSSPAPVMEAVPEEAMEAVEEDAVELPPSMLPSSGRTERYAYSAQKDASTAAGVVAEEEADEDDEDDAATRRKKEELHRQFVQKLGHPDSLPRGRRRAWMQGGSRSGGAAWRADSGEGGVEGDGEGGEGGEGGDGGDGGDEDEEEAQPKGKKGAKAGKLTPMEEQFLAIKRAHPDTLLVVEVGYKFRFFGEDARTAARTLGIVCVPGKVRYDEDASEAHLARFASASIPVPRLAVHVRRLVAAGLKVGIVRQMETAALKKAGDNRAGPFVRRLTAVYTKGTYVDEDVATAADSAGGAGGGGPGPGGYILCLCETAAGGGGADERVDMGVVAVQPTTGDILYDRFTDGFLRSGLETRLLHIAPVELVLVGTLSRATEKVVQHLSGSAAHVFGDRTRVERVAGIEAAAAQATVAAFYADLHKERNAEDGPDTDVEPILDLPPPVLVCLAALMDHLREYGLANVFALGRNFSAFATRQHMRLSGTALESLEVYRNATDHRTHGSLLWALDRTRTRGGHRLLRSWLGRPLLDGPALRARSDAVAELVARADRAPRERLERLLATGGRTDLERSLIRIYYGRCGRPELAAVLEALAVVGSFYGAGAEGDSDDCGFTSPLLRDAVAALPPVAAVVAPFRAQVDLAAARRNDAYGFFRAAAETEAMTQHRLGIAAVEADLEAARADVAAALRWRAPKAYVTVAGIEYLVEVAQADVRHVPAAWVKISGTKRVSRFHPPAVAALLREREQHREALAAACDAAFAALQRAVAACYRPLRDAVAAVATLDVVVSLARVAAQPGYVRPVLVEEGADGAPCLQIVGGRHPVAEQTLPGGYIPFSVELGDAASTSSPSTSSPSTSSPSTSASRPSPSTLLVTGPNMGGKSSFVRAVALLTLLAQVGAFVPADAMRWTLADAVHTRMGAHDNLLAGESTFMVELSETATMLRTVTRRSLVLLDELGRGTSTHDGAAIAHAVLDHMARHVGARTLFITHYQSLARVADGLRDPRGRPLVRNVHMRFTASRPGNDNDDDANDDANARITFLYEVAPGMAHRSYGLNVARLARIPPRVLDCAASKSREMEHNIRVRRLQAAAALASTLLGPQSAGDHAADNRDRLDLLVSSIEQL